MTLLHIIAHLIQDAVMIYIIITVANHRKSLKIILEYLKYELQYKYEQRKRNK